MLFDMTYYRIYIRVPRVQIIKSIFKTIYTMKNDLLVIFGDPQTIFREPRVEKH